MTTTIPASLRVATLAILLVGLTACSGARVLRKPLAVPESSPLASAADERLEIAVGLVVVRNGPGSWARNADWDEYQLLVRNLGEDRLQIESVAIVNSLGGEHTNQHDRKVLVRQSDAVARSYGQQGVKVQAGVGADTLMLASGAAAVGGTTLGLAALGTASASTATAAATVGLAALAAVPVLVGAAAYTGARDHNVSKALRERHTALPFPLEPGEQRKVVVFVALSPSPRAVDIRYTRNGTPAVLRLEGLRSLEGLHLQPN